MPFYDYECKRCKLLFDEMLSIEKRNSARCPKCGGGVKLLIKEVPAVHFHEPYYDTQLGVTIASPREKKEVAKSLGLTNVGDAKDHEIEKVANANKKAKDSDEPTEEFMEAWKKAKAQSP